MKLLFNLFWLFFKIGLFTFGGGYAMISVIKEVFVEKKKWLTEEELLEIITIAESTPGPIGVNMATYVGFTTSGILGSLASTICLVAPSVIIICIIANYFQKFKDAKIVKQIFSGLKPAVVAFIVSAVLGLFTTTLFNLENSGIQIFDFKCILLLAVLMIIRKKYQKLHPIVFIVLAAVTGIIFQF